MTSILNQTLKYIRRNKELSVATITVTTITFIIGSIFFIAISLAQRTVKFIEQQPHLIVMYDPDIPDESISAVKDFQKTLETYPEILNVSFTDKSQAVDEYRDRYEPNTEKEDFNQERFPPNLKIKLHNIKDADKIKGVIQEEKETNGLIKEVIFMEDVINKIKFISNAIKFGGFIIVVFLFGISVALILITIGFNISRYGTEIEIMQLIGATPRSIMMPFTIQGGIYGLTGALLSDLTFLIIYLFITLLVSLTLNQSSDGSVVLVTNFLQDLGLTKQSGFSIITFIVMFVVVKALLGLALGLSSGYLASKKYIK